METLTHLATELGGVVFGKLSACTPTIFQWQWPNNVCAQLISNENPKGTITTSNLEMVGLLLLWLTMEGVCGPLQEKRVSMFGDNSQSIGWVKRLAFKRSLVAEHLVPCTATKNSTCLSPDHNPFCGQEKRNLQCPILIIWQ